MITIQFNNLEVTCQLLMPEVWYHSSADSDLPSLEDKLSLVYSSIKKKLICECPAI